MARYHWQRDRGFRITQESHARACAVHALTAAVGIPLRQPPERNDRLYRASQTVSKLRGKLRKVGMPFVMLQEGLEAPVQVHEKKSQELQEIEDHKEAVEASSSYQPLKDDGIQNPTPRVEDL